MGKDTIKLKTNIKVDHIFKCKTKFLEEIIKLE